MADYSPTTWVENVTKVGPTNLNKIEQAILAAGKRASLVPGAQADTSQVEWKRAANGALVAYRHVNESISGTDISIVDNDYASAQLHGSAIKNIRAENQTDSYSSTLVLIADPNSGAGQRAVAKAVAVGVSGSFTVKLVDDNGASDFMRNPTNFQDLTGTSAWNTPRQPNALRSTLVHLTLGGVANTQHSVYVGPSNPPTQRVAISGGGVESAAWRAHTIIVPPGFYYRYTQDTGAPGIGVRIEWTL